MKKTMLALMMVSVLIFSMAAPAVCAEEEDPGSMLGGLLEMVQSAFSEEEGSGEYVVENIVKSILVNIGEEAEKQGIGVDELLDNVINDLKDEEGNFDMNALGGLLGGILGFGDDGDSVWESDDYAVWQEKMAAIDAYILEEYKDDAEEGDIRIVNKMNISKDEAPATDEEESAAESAEEAVEETAAEDAAAAEEGQMVFMGYYSVYTYTPDGSELKLKKYSGNVEILTVAKNEEGKYEVAEAVKAEDGDAYEASIASMCEAYGVSVESLESSMESVEWLELLTINYYLDEHPEVEKIEYDGAMRTPEELEEIESAAISEAFAGAGLAEDEGESLDDAPESEESSEAEE